MNYLNDNPSNGLYVFGGEKAQGAEIVIERLIATNKNVAAHLIISPGNFASKLLATDKPYKITLFEQLKKLNRSSASKAKYYWKAIKNYIFVPFKTIKYIKDNNINFVHVNTIVPASYLLPAVIYCRVFYSRVQWYWSDHDMRYFTKVESLLANLCAKLYSKTIVVSNAVKSKYRENEKVVVLYNGLDINEFEPDSSRRIMFRTAHNISNATIVIGMAAVITPDKGQLSLIQAIKSLSDRHGNIALLLAGGFADDSPSYSQTVAEEISKSNHISYLGFVDNIIDFYNGCDIIVNNSNNYRSESLGTSIYEAMACGKIVIASATGGTPEIIAQNEDGLLFEPDDEQALTQCLDYVIENYHQLDKIKEAARQKVIAKFNISKMISDYNSILTL